LSRRHEERERALSLLYEAEMKGVTSAELLAELPVAPTTFEADVVEGVAAHGAEIDALVERFSVDWALDRMPVIDRTILRMAIYELTWRPDVPTGAVISEAVELARRYSTEDSGRFVNGLLASVAAEVRPAEV
jgi:N utilization substance protein B